MTGGWSRSLSISVRRSLIRQSSLPIQHHHSTAAFDSDVFNSSVYLSPASVLSAHAPRARSVSGLSVTPSPDAMTPPADANPGPRLTATGPNSQRTAENRRLLFKRFRELVQSVEIEAVPGALAPCVQNRIVLLNQQVRVCCKCWGGASQKQVLAADFVA